MSKISKILIISAKYPDFFQCKIQCEPVVLPHPGVVGSFSTLNPHIISSMQANRKTRQDSYSPDGLFWCSIQLSFDTVRQNPGRTRYPGERSEVSTFQVPFSLLNRTNFLIFYREIDKQGNSSIYLITHLYCLYF